MARVLASSGCLLIAAAAIAPAPAGAQRTVVRISDRAPVYSAPGGSVLLRDDGPVLERGSAWVERRRGDWLGIRTAQRRDGALGWIRLTPARELAETEVLVSVDLSERRVVVWSAGRPVFVARVGVGSPSSPTPATSTSVSSRITVTPSSGYSREEYGPAIVALRLWQPAVSPGFPAGGLMAFHGGASDDDIGRAVSAGCVRMRDVDVVRLAELVEAGTPVIIRA